MGHGCSGRSPLGAMSVLCLSHLKPQSSVSRESRDATRGEAGGGDRRCRQPLETGSWCHFERSFREASDSHGRQGAPAEKDQEPGSQKGQTLEKNHSYS